MGIDLSPLRQAGRSCLIKVGVMYSPGEKGQSLLIKMGGLCSYRYPRLVSITRRCPCGRRVTHPVVPQGTEAEPLACDDECAVQARRAQLARAFDIADPDSHVPVQDRNRIATYSPELLAYAHEHLQWIKDVSFFQDCPE